MTTMMIEEQEVAIRKFFGVDTQTIGTGIEVCDYAAQIRRFGIRQNDRVLVIGGKNRALLRRLAKTVGPRGKLTVAPFDLDIYTELKQAARAGLFKTFQAIRAGDSPIVVRGIHGACYAPVPLHIERLSGCFLPFRDKEFHFAWVEELPERMFMVERDQLMVELNRVTRDKTNTPTAVAK